MKDPATNHIGHAAPAGAAGTADHGRRYWRGLDELCNTPEFQQWLEREFPEGASELTDGLTRRHFMKIMGASFLLAGIGLTSTGCRRPVERIVPFSKDPENNIHGTAQFYATAMPCRGSALPLVVRSNDGRPTKIEGNNLLEETGGGTDRYAQASILNLYDPDRAMDFKERGDTRTRAQVNDFLARLSAQAAQSGGRGVAFVLEPSQSPSRARLVREIRQKLPNALWALFDPVDVDGPSRIGSQAVGKPVRQKLLLENAEVVLSLDSDFLGNEADTTVNARAFASRRKLEKPEDGLNRLYVVEALYSLTGFSADHRLRAASSLIPQITAAIASQILPQGTVGEAQPPAWVDPKWIAECAKDLAAHRGKCLVLAGQRQPPAVHMLAHALNAALGNFGQTIALLPAEDSPTGDLRGIVEQLNSGAVQTLCILGGNPVYSAPADLEFHQAMQKARTVVRLGYYEDETSRHVHWHLPEAHYLESWGDGRTSRGTYVPVQPLIEPLFGGMTELEVLARIAGSQETNPYDIVRRTFSQVSQGDDVEGRWRKFLHDGFLASSEPPPIEAALQPEVLNQALGEIKATAPSKAALELIFHRDYSLDDGRYNNNGWLQELPDPITKMVWDNAALMSRKTARELGVKNTEVVEITLGNRTVQAPVWVQPGMADYCVGLALGYGRERTGRVGRAVGFNATRLRLAATPHIAQGATLRSTGKTYSISCTQTHWSMEGRPAVREANLEQYRHKPDFPKAMALEHGTPVSMYPNPLDKIKPLGLHQWGMAIDLNRCIGCSACVIACQSENNIPIVGKDQVRRGREMHWLRIDRYYAGRPDGPAGSPEARKNKIQTFTREEDQQFEEWIDNVQVVTQPMLCQHCEAAPCENVCPVNATSHDQEGLNVMTYNRCVGTRYCSNNCPYKVRRFNFFDYNKRPIDKLYLGPLAKRPDDEWDLIRMIKNPDVTVRMRGVMEKCTFCLQRIESAKIIQKTKAGASADVVVPEGTFTTACAQACSSGAIAFGNLNDPHSRVSALKAQDRNYSVLEELFTRPRTTYLARVRNPNKLMPDYYEAPASLREYKQRMGDPFEVHHGSGTPEGQTDAGKGGHH